MRLLLVEDDAELAEGLAPARIHRDLVGQLAREGDAEDPRPEARQFALGPVHEAQRLFRDIHAAKLFQHLARIRANDRPGLLRDLSALVSQAGVNVTAARAQATVAAAMEYEVEILLTGRTGELASPGVAQKLHFSGDSKKTVYDLISPTRL